MRMRRMPDMATIMVVIAGVSVFGLAACATMQDLEYRPWSDEANETPLICRDVEMKCEYYQKNLKAAKGKSTPGLELLRQDCEESRAACANTHFLNRKPTR